MMLIKITVRQANAMLKGNHYLGRVVASPQHCIATETLDAVAVFNWPTANHFAGVLSNPLELTRLWQSQKRRETGRPLSSFLKGALCFLKQLAPDCDCVFSYTDPHQIGPNGKPHDGTVYQWTGFSKLGASRVTDVWIKRDLAGVKRISSPQMWRLHGTKSRAKLIALGYELDERPPKILYVYGLNKTVKEIRNIIGGRYGIPANEPVDRPSSNEQRPNVGDYNVKDRETTH